MSNFGESINKLQGQKVRFYLGGGDRGFVQGPIVRVEGDLIYIEKQGEIRGTLHTITINASNILYYEIDKIATE